MSSALPNKLAFVDIETTGCSTFADRIIEIGILRVEDGVLTKTYSTLVNPQSYIPPEIERITGINPDSLEHAPTFRQVKDDVLEILSDCVFVAHNVRFDYGFIKNEFKRNGLSFRSKHFCTVKLSRFLFPQQKNHNLDSVIDRFSIACPNRHRAFDDAAVLWEFFKILTKTIDNDLLVEAINKGLRRPSLPVRLSQDTLEALPEGPGVYIFYGSENAPLYVGKSINIHDRVLSHFAADTESSTEMKIAQQIERIETIETSGELGALIKESHMIKTLQPLYNKRLRHARKMVILKRKEVNGYYSISIEDADTIHGDELDQILGVFRSKKQVKAYLVELAKEYELCDKLLSLEQTKSACFGHRLDRCKGACIGKEMTAKYNMRFIMAFSKTKVKHWPFEGPIVIKEKSEELDREDGYVVDKWCYLGSISEQLGSQNTKLQNDMTFDIDLYKIIDRYLRKGNHSHITPVPRDQLQGYFN